MKTKTRDIWKRWLLLFGLGLCYILVLILLAAVESGSPEGKIRSFGDAFWYSIVTLSTVGYGDLYPVTALGRWVGLILVLMSVGLLSFIVSAMIGLLTGQLLPVVQMFLLRGRTWYMFSEWNDASVALARSLTEKDPKCICLFPQSQRRKVSDDFTCVFYSNSMVQTASRKKDHCTLFFVNAESGVNFSLALAALEAGHPVYCRTEQAPEHCPVQLKLFSRYDCCARDYWRKMRLSEDEKNVVIIGDGRYAQRLLERALLINVFGSERQISYHVFGKWENFRRNHHRLHTTIAIDQEKEGMDSLYFHNENWNTEETMLYNADRIIVCSDSEQENLSVLMQLRRFFVTKGQVHVRALTPIPGERIFGSNEEIYSAEIVLRNRQNVLAKAMHQIYCDSAQSDIPAWNELSEFLRQSNIAAADHLPIKMQILLGEKFSGRVTKEDCEAAYLRYSQLDDTQRNRCRSIEHLRWMRFHSLHNWRYGPVRDNGARIHPMMVPFAELALQEQKKDDYAWLLLEVLAGYLEET